MRYWFGLLLACLFSASAWSDAGDIGAASRSVVRVTVFSSMEGQRTYVGHGSGVVVAPDKIITNAHVAESAQYDESVTFRIVPSEGSVSYEAKLIATLPGKDLALLQLLGGARLTPAALFSGPVPDGADVFAIGYPANVDVALESSEDDIMRPQPPVKTRGTVSAGRSSKSIDSILHTAPIAPGNSGGPLVDACGRVLGINSFGSVADGGGSEFYFAISIRELAAFLRAQNVPYSAATSECRSAAELTRAEAERDAATRAKIEAENRRASEKRASSEGKTRREAEFAVISARENHLALATFLLIIALGAGGTAWQFHERSDRDKFKLAAGISGALTLGAIIVFMIRPSFAQVEERVRAALTEDALSEATNIAAPKVAKAGKKTCIIQADRSRITVSDTADVAFTWSDNGCVNGRTQYAEDSGRWTRTFVPNNEAQVSVISYAPDTNSYRIERYLLGMDAMAKARAARNQYDVMTCNADQPTREKIENMNKTIREVVPPSPNETLVFECADMQ